MSEPTIRAAADADDDALWAILDPVLRAGETYALPTDWDRAAALGFWRQPAHAVFVAETTEGVAATYYLTANKLGPGDHVANCGYVTASWAEGRGLARALCRHSLEEARARGFLAMQFNAVVATNPRAIRLWQSLGFAVVGRVPAAFRQPRDGFVDLLVMWRALSR